MLTVTITNQKGGVGKTTTAQILTTGLLHEGYKVLAVDVDPQTNFTYSAGIDPQETGLDIYDLFTDHVKRGETPSLQAIKTAPAGFDIIPGSLGLAGADMEFSQQGREYILKEILEPVKEKYDFCVIDTPPTLGILTVNALTASDRVIVPMGADVFSLQGLSQLQGMIANTKKYCNPRLIIDGLLLTKYNPRAVINQNLKESLEQIAAQLQTRLYSSCIRETVAIKEIQFLQADIFAQYPRHKVTQDYKAFIDEFLKGCVDNGKQEV